MAQPPQNDRWSYVGPLVAAGVAAFLFVLLNLNDEKQWALLVAVGGFLVTYVSPILQTSYAREMNRRDAARFAREEAERKKAPDLRVTTGTGNSLEFWPIGGHRKKNGGLSFYVFVENTGDAPANDVTVNLGRPPAAIPVILKPAEMTGWTENGEMVTVENDDKSHKQILFKQAVLSYPLATDVGTVHLDRPLHPGPARCIGIVAFNVPQGTYQVPWSVESNYGLFKSNDETTLNVTLNDTAQGHDVVMYGDNPVDKCRFCHALQRRPSWIQQVEGVLQRHRLMTWDKNPKLTPKLMQDGISAQWYQEWKGPHRWVKCEVTPAETDTVTATFWTEPDWDGREVRIVSMDDYERFAEDVWEFLKPPIDGEIL